MSFSEQQILDLAPDESSAKAAMQLAHSAKWVKRCVHPQALWGDCQGSGKNPYRTSIDLANLAFKCTCPSRKFPCKHGLGLMLLFARQGQTFSAESELPDELRDWLQKRSHQQEQKERKAETTVSKPIDEGAALKRVQAREKKVRAGIDELQTWIKDTVRIGIMNLSQNHYEATRSIIARMNDAQAPGLAFLLKKINAVNFTEDGWQQYVIRLLSKIYIITVSYTNRAAYEPDLAAELESIIGWTIPKEDVLTADGVTDQWQVLARQIENDDQLTVSSTWLYGKNTNRFAVLMDYYTRNQLPSDILSVGRKIEAELCFYPGRIPMRALIKRQVAQQQGIELTGGFTTVKDLKNHVAEMVSILPFGGKIPLIFKEFKLVLRSNRWFIVDAFSMALPLSNSNERCWEILAITKGKYFSGCALYDNTALTILSFVCATTLYDFS